MMMTEIKYICNSDKLVSFCYSEINNCRSFDAPDNYVGVSNGRRRRVLMLVATNLEVSPRGQMNRAQSKVGRSGRTGT